MNNTWGSALNNNNNNNNFNYGRPNFLPHIVYIIDIQPDLYKQYCNKIKEIDVGDEND